MTETRAGFRRPPPLEAGARVRLVAPSGIVDRERFWRGHAWLESRGYEVVFDEGVFARHRYHAGDDDRRFVELQAAVDDLDAAAIWVVRGGYGATRLLSRLDRSALGRRARWLVGFSDATALHAVWHRAGVTTLHGPNVVTIGAWASSAREALAAWLSGGVDTRVPGRLVSGEAGVVAPLLGGNLSLLAALAGTPFVPPLSGSLLFLEDLDEAPYRVDRLVTQLVQAGVLDGVAGVVVGQLTRCGNSYDEGLEAVLAGLRGIDVPVLAGVPAGHEPDSQPLPLGVAARMEADGLVLHA